QLPPQTTILDVFDNPTISGKFLILGKPGGGKTTTLLELAEALIERAEGDSDAAIPVILELSSWQEVTKPKFLKFLPFGKPEKYDPSIKEWVLSQLMSQGVSQEIGEEWLQQKELVLLLDGLDELQPERQGKCVRAINQFLGGEFSPLHLVVCSRKEEYEDYEEMLRLNGAICLEDLTNEQIQDYFTSVNLGEFWESIKGSEKIVNFIRQPLFLAITSLAYQQIDVEEWRNCNTEERAIDYLLGVYRVKMLTNNKTSNVYRQNKPKSGVCQNALTRLIKYSPRELRLESIPKEISADCFEDSVLYSNQIKIIYLLLIYFISVPICSLFSQSSISLILDRLSDRTNLIVVDYLGYLTFYLTIVIFFAILGFGFFFLIFAAWENELPFVKSVSYKWIRNLIHLIIYFISLPIIILCGLMALSILWEMSGGSDSSYLQTQALYDTWRQGEPFKNSFVRPLLLAVWTTSAYFGITDFLDTSYNSGIRPIPRKLAFSIDVCIITLLGLVSIAGWVFIMYCLFEWKNPIKIIFQNTSLFTLFLFVEIGLGISMGFFVSENKDTLHTTLDTNQSKISFKYINASASISIVVAIILFCIGLFLGFISTFQFGLNVALSNGIMIGMFLGMLAGFSCIQYFSLRLTLWLTGQMPWNITRFLDYCTERLILQRVGNRYRFIHRLVQEHFAKLEIQ
ncbi:MAG: NACHT domain-containing protein, partial [Geitlerinemataceae cyanobacterium]